MSRSNQPAFATDFWKAKLIVAGILFAALAAAQPKGPLWQKSDVHNERGTQLARAGKRAEAIQEFRKSLKIMPDPAVYLNLGLAYRESGDYLKALASFDKGLELNPNHMSLYCERAVAEYHLGRARQAESDIAQLKRRDPQTAQKWDSYLAQVRAETRDVSFRPPAFPGTPTDWFNDGVKLYSAEDDREALDRLTAAIDKTGDPDARLYRANCENNLRHYDLALEDLNAVIRAKPKWGEAYRVRGRIFWAYGDYNRALAEFDQAIADNPKLALAYIDRANLNYAFRPNLQARIQSDLQRAVEVDPTNPFAWHNHAAIYMGRDQPQPAIQDLNRAIELKPDLAVSYMTRGLLYY